mgnify:CR=1 FL=1|tara:strand:- start:968 stop:1792 length:825 start_codon:yes stop_codon:yes gene_type:complete
MLIINEITTLIDSLCMESTQVVLNNLIVERQQGTMAVAIGISTAVSIGASIFGASAASKREKRAREEKRKLTNQLETLERKRQTVINPYEDVSDLSEMVSDLSSISSNPFANLTVATGAAEMQIEEADIALANTLDTLRATGASAGGATALARMALESKKGVSASIQQQEAQNNQMRASGEERLQKVQLDEAKRVQTTLMSEADYQRRADVQGEIYKFETQESRDEQMMSRKQAQITGAAQAESSAATAKSQAIQSGISAVGDGVSAFAMAKKS